MAAGPGSLRGPRSRSGAAGKPSSVLIAVPFRACNQKRPFLYPRRCRRDAGRSTRAVHPPHSDRTSRTRCRGTEWELLDLARGGVCHAPAVTNRAVRSYRTLSPLPVRPEGRHRRSALCGTFPRPRSRETNHRAGGRYPPPHPAVLGLSSMPIRRPTPRPPCHT